MPGLGRSVTGLLWIEKKCGLLFILMGIRKLPTIISNYWSRKSLLGILALNLHTCLENNNNMSNLGISFGRFGPICMLWTLSDINLLPAVHWEEDKESHYILLGSHQSLFIFWLFSDF